jgi:hypothetical protein
MFEGGQIFFCYRIDIVRNFDDLLNILQSENGPTLVKQITEGENNVNVVHKILT